MHRNRIGFWVIVAVILSMLVVQTALAGSETISGITFNGPNTHSSCVDAPTSDTVTITGLTNHKPSAKVQGAIKLYYVEAGGAYVLIHSYTVNSTTDVHLTINYPPVSQWPFNNGTQELHADVSINVIVGGKLVGTFDGSPNLGWDVYCSTGTATPTATKTVGGGHTATPTATATGTIMGTGGHTATPTQTPVSGGNTPTETPVNVGSGSTPTPTVETTSTANTPVANTTPGSPAQGTGATPGVIPVTGAPGLDPFGLVIILFVGALLIATGFFFKRTTR